ncbi:radical SAM protein [Kosmotoga arenicorallina S304]|uniref:Radical SAM protein n=1 Tax=Kosmotoga arenicorallina S304 TaxID=1453497 RepID=A0A176JXI8_9BACT|nr:radical SAM protein [Kosmotoga arenicorallina]OAA28434.1 radical SAM protein [Kosmotoga arenicorallina S304]
MQILEKYGRDDIAWVFLGKTSKGNTVEFVESVQPPIPREDKEVIIISTLVGCPAGCFMCDAGGFYEGKLSAGEMLEQIDYIVCKRFGDFKVPSKKFKIQFARMGEPALNDEVLEVLKELPRRYIAPGLLPSISTIAPVAREAFFESLIEIKNEYYASGRFQLQFSIHSTDYRQRDAIIPVKKWNFKDIAEYGKRFYKEGDRKITLNFALGKENIIEAEKIREFFDPDIFLIKITPVNPTYRAIENNIESAVDSGKKALPYHPGLLEKFEEFGYQVILSIGELEENKIGSNCGQFVQRHLNSKLKISEAYKYESIR